MALCATLRLAFFICALTPITAIYSMQPIKRNLANLEAALRSLEDDSSDEDDGEQGTHWLEAVSHELHKLSGQLNPLSAQRKTTVPATTHAHAQRAHAQQALGIKNNMTHANRAPDPEPLYGPLSLSPEEESELLGNPDPSSPSGSPQDVAARAAYSIPKPPPSPRAHATPVLAMSVALVSQGVHAASPSTPRYQDASNFSINIASMEPGKTGDIGGEIRRFYRTKAKPRYEQNQQ